MLTLALSPYFDELLTTLAKLDALLKIAGNSNITELEPDTALNYFWIASDVLSEAKQICDRLAKIPVY